MLDLTSAHDRDAEVSARRGGLTGLARLSYQVRPELVAKAAAMVVGRVKDTSAIFQRSGANGSARAGQQGPPP